VQAHHGHRAQSAAARLAQRAPHARLIQRPHQLTVRADPLIGLDDLRVQQLRQQDPAIEDARAVLVGDAERVPEALRDHQDGRVALPLEQGVGGHGGTQADGVDGAGGDFVARAESE
jgi:hypothetical protein